MSQDDLLGWEAAPDFTGLDDRDLPPGMAVGHCYYFMEDIFPQQPGGWRILKTPHFLRYGRLSWRKVRSKEDENFGNNDTRYTL